MPVQKPIYDDPFRPRLNPEKVWRVPNKPGQDGETILNLAQRYNIREVLSYSCSDSRFAQKAYEAIINIVEMNWTIGDPPPPEPLMAGMETKTPPPADQVLTEEQLKEGLREREDSRVR